MTVHVPSRSAVEHVDRDPLDRRELTAIIARDIPRGSYVNLGIGQPTTHNKQPRSEIDVIPMRLDEPIRQARHDKGDGGA